MMLTFDDKLEEYILSHIDPEPAELGAIYRHTYLHCPYPRMCSGHYQGRLLKMLTAMIAPKRVLELGAFTGYSTLAIAEALAAGAVIDTVEIDPERAEELAERFATSPLGARIRLHVGDALDIVPGLDETYRMVFIDANKRHYSAYLEAVYPLVEPGGFILVDNTLWDMKIVGQSATDPQSAAIARFNDELAADVRFEKIILPVRDGLTLIRKL